MKCIKCGFENTAGTIICKSCGEDLNPEPSQENTTASKRFEPGQLLIQDRFKIIKKLGKGGMGAVLLAEDIKLKRKVAIKSILTGSLPDSSAKSRFLREAQTISRLDHPNICTLYEIYEEDDHDYIVMQYVEGVTLDQIIDVKPLSILRTLDIALQLCSGMMEAHENCIIHRDIKPGNIMVDKKGVVKILDFGLAKFRKNTPSNQEDSIDKDITERGFVLGTVSYLSPEQASGKPVDHQSDIFSYGILMYEMLEGKNPFREEEQIETLYNILNKKVEFTRDIPEVLKAIVLKTLEKDKKDRYSNFPEIKEDLEQFRLDYVKLKDKQTLNSITESLDQQEQQKLLEEMQKSSDNEGLGDLVYKITKFKASTERVHTLGNKKGWWARLAIIFVIIAFILTAVFFIDNIDKKENNTLKHQGASAAAGPGFYMYIKSFENPSKEPNLAEMLHYLLTESLDQFKEFKVMDHESTGKFKADYQLTGKISVMNDLYTIEAVLSPTDKSLDKKQLTITGKSKNSLLSDQVDNLSKRIYTTFFPTENFQKFPFKKISGIFGADWQTFSNFYQGNLYKNRLESDKAKRFLLKANNLLITKYVLADLFYFEASRNKALRLVNEMMPHIDLLTEAMKNRVLGLKARLDFDFQKEIENLEKLKNDFPFSKEAFYELGNAYFHHGSAEKALEYYQNALELDRDYSIALNRMGFCYSYVGNHVKAIEAFEEYNRLDQSANSFDSLGDGYFYAGELDSAIGMKELAISTDEKSVPWAYMTLVDVETLEARYQETEKLLVKYQQLRPSDKYQAIVLAKKAYMCYLNKDYKTALDRINQSLADYDSAEINDNSAEAHWLKGIILSTSGYYIDSQLELDWLKNFKEKYKMTQENFQPAYKYYIHLEAILKEQNKDTAGAEEKFKFLVAMKSRLSYWITYYNYQFFHTEYAAFLLRRQRYQQALKEIDRCLEFNTNYIPALWLKAEILEKVDNPQRLIVYNKIAELYGEATERNYLRDLLKEKLK
ncbi:MAG: Non-specific serine/threonine protein kinase [Acidobacteriota bacterium]|nr:Non-specific serine/threonine protein kinase [Acidobacteriota bacterium]